MGSFGSVHLSGIDEVAAAAAAAGIGGGGAAGAIAGGAGAAAVAAAAAAVGAAAPAPSARYSVAPCLPDSTSRAVTVAVANCRRRFAQ